MICDSVILFICLSEETKKTSCVRVHLKSLFLCAVNRQKYTTASMHTVSNLFHYFPTENQINSGVSLDTHSLLIKSAQNGLGMIIKTPCVIRQSNPSSPPAVCSIIHIQMDADTETAWWKPKHCRQSSAHVSQTLTRKWNWVG